MLSLQTQIGLVTCNQILMHTIVGTLSFGLMFYLLKKLIFISKDSKTMHNIHSRIVSMTHGLLIILVTAYYLAKVEFSDNMQLTIFEVKILTFSLSYFIYDIIGTTYYDMMDNKVLLHHVVAIIAIIFGLVLPDSNYLIILNLFIGEISNPAMNLRYFCRFYGMKHTYLYELIDIMYMATYTLFRGLSPFIILPMYFKYRINYGLLAFSLIILFQSYYFISRMFKIFENKVSEYKCRHQQNIHYFWFSVNHEVEQLRYIKKNDDALW